MCVVPELKSEIWLINYWILYCICKKWCVTLCHMLLYTIHRCRHRADGNLWKKTLFDHQLPFKRIYINKNIFLCPLLVSSFRRAGWAGRGRGWWPVKPLPLPWGKMRSPPHFTARRRKRKSIWAKSSSTSPSASAYSAWSGSSTPSTCGPAWPNGWWPCTRHLLSWMPIAAVPRFPRRGSGAHTGLRSTLAWKPGRPVRWWQVRSHIQSQAKV